jgi:Brp/Blh family beta-carotene 15,15'-monooxygenase
MSRDSLPLLLLFGTLVFSSFFFISGLDARWLVYLPWAISVFLWGLPHGAADHVVMSTLISGQSPMPRALVCYVGIMLVYCVIWLISTKIAATLFLLMTVWHWGSADAWRSFARAGSKLQTRLWFMAGLFRGVVPVLAPLVLYREVVASVLVSMIPELDSPQIIAFIPSPQWILAVLVVSQTLWMVVMQKIGSRLGIETLETTLILAVLILIHPIASVGAYFTFWHALGHDRRLKSWYKSGRHAFLAPRSLRKDQTGIMMVTLAGLILMWAWMPPGKDALAMYLIAISVMTLPHMVVVWGMDKFDAQIQSRPVIQAGI